MNKEQVDEIIINCQKCYLHQYEFNKQDECRGHGKLLGWFGGEKADLMFVGMNPSHNRFPGLKYAFGGKDYEYGTGVEFVRLLKDSGVLERSYVTNLVKCSTSTNQISKGQVDSCEKNLRNEINLVKPKVIIAMGKLVSQFIKRNLQFYEFLLYNKIRVEEIWHPNYVFSYNRPSIEKYKNQIKEVIDG